MPRTRKAVTTVEATPPTFIAQVDLERIIPSPNNPRETMDKEALERLAASIAEQGILEPLLVAPHPADPSLFLLIAGHRRFEAAKIAKTTGAPVLVRTDLDEKGIDQARLVENLHREDLTPLEEARGFRRLVDEHGMTQTEVAKVTGLNQGNISRKLQLLNLIPAAQTLVQSGALGGVAGYNLSQLDADRQAEVIKAFKSKPHTFDTAMNSAQAKQARLEEVAGVRTDLDKLGVAYIEIPNYGGAEAVYDREAGPYPVRHLPPGGHLSADAKIVWHRDQPCSMAFLHHHKVEFISDNPLDRYVEWGCTDPASHFNTTTAADPAGADNQADDDETPEPQEAPEIVAERAKIENDRKLAEAAQRARQDAAQSRRTFIRDAILAGRSPKGAGEYLHRMSLQDALLRRADPATGEDQLRLAAWMLGLDEEGMTTWAVAQAYQEQIANGKGDQLLRWALAFRLALDELMILPKYAFHQRGDDTPNGPTVLAHLDFLTAQGYELTPGEQYLHVAQTSLEEQVRDDWYDPDDEPAADDDNADEVDPIQQIA